MRLNALRNQRGFSNNSVFVAVLVMIGLYLGAVLCYLPPSPLEKKIVKVLDVVLTYCAGRPVHVNFHNFFDQAMERINMAQRSIVKQDKERMQLFKQGK